MSERADIVSRMVKGIAPFATGLLGVFLLALPVRLFGGFVPMPIIPLAVVFFWTLHDPERLPSSAVFIIGLFQDALTGTPFGLWSSVYLSMKYIVLSQRSYFLGREPQVIWIGFMLTAGGAALLVWLVMSLMAGFTLPMLPLGIQLAATIFFYPVFGRLFRQIRQRIRVEV